MSIIQDMPDVFGLDKESIISYHNKQKTKHRNFNNKYVNLWKVENLNQHAAPTSLLEYIRMILEDFPANFEWSSIKEQNLSLQKYLWTRRQLLFTHILLYVSLTINDTQNRVVPKGFSINDYKCNLFGSENPTSDIDVGIEGPDSSFVISVIEDTWLQLTGRPSLIWDIEFYGDFLIFLDENDNPSFLNSREFDNYDHILPFVGASILRNTGTLEFDILNTYIDTYKELQHSNWKQKAIELMDGVYTMTYDQQREEYYRLLSIAEGIVKNIRHFTKETMLEVFLALCEANIYRSENYILPSTVIHVVRDLQAASPQPVDEECMKYHSRLATCSLGSFTYLCSALEQIGYLERFKDDPKKIKKYMHRLEDAMAKYNMQGGGRKKTRKSRKKIDRRSRRV